jgi:hypothetical protein
LGVVDFSTRVQYFSWPVGIIGFFALVAVGNALMALLDRRNARVDRNPDRPA